MYLKITNLEEIHHGLQYHDGLVEDTIPFAREGSCIAGGIYFTTPEFICYFLKYGSWIRKVTIPEDAEIVQDPEGDKWRASKVILSPRKSLAELDTWKWLIENGVYICIEDNYELRYASSHGYLEVVKFLIENGANIHINNDEALRYSAARGHLEVVKYLVEQGANIHAENDATLKSAVVRRHLKVVKYLVEQGADIHTENDYVLRWSTENGYLEVVEFLMKNGK
jgi:hypothetical protein